MWLSPVFNRRYRQQFDAAAKIHNQRLLWKGPIPFNPSESNDQLLAAWAAVNFGGRVDRKAPQLLHQLVDLFGLRDVQILHHGDIVGRKPGHIRVPQWLRPALAIFALSYVPIAIVGSIALFVFVFGLGLPLISKIIAASLIHIAILGQALHGVLILIEPLRARRRIGYSFHSALLPKSRNQRSTSSEVNSYGNCRSKSLLTPSHPRIRCARQRR